jgi:hypothetical protein
VLDHRPHRLVDRVIGADRDRLAFGELGYGRGGGVRPLGKALDHAVAVGDHARQPVVLTADRQSADIQVAHLARRISQGLVSTHALRAVGHDDASSRHDVASSRAVIGAVPTRLGEMRLNSPAA